MNTYQVTWYPPYTATNTPSAATVHAVDFEIDVNDMMLFFDAEPYTTANVVFAIPMDLHPVIARTA